MYALESLLSFPLISVLSLELQLAYFLCALLPDLMQFVYTVLHCLQRTSVINKTQAKRTMASITGAQKVQIIHSLTSSIKIMSLVTKKDTVACN